VVMGSGTLRLFLDAIGQGRRFYGRASERASVLVEAYSPFAGTDAEWRVFGGLCKSMVEHLESAPFDDKSLTAAAESAIEEAFPMEWVEKGHSFCVSQLCREASSNRIWIANVGSNVVLEFGPFPARRLVRAHSSACEEHPGLELRPTVGIPPGVATAVVSAPGDFSTLASRATIEQGDNDWILVTPETWPIVRGETPAVRETPEELANEIRKLFHGIEVSASISCLIVVSPPTREGLELLARLAL
jgi:hypothetical protein